MAPPPCVHGGGRSEAVLRLCGLLLRPPFAPRGRQPRGGLAGFPSVPVRAPPPLADRGVGDVEGHAARSLPEAGEEVGGWRWRSSSIVPRRGIWALARSGRRHPVS